jgi:MFS family permease
MKRVPLSVFPRFNSEQKKLILLSSFGGALEFYDFIIFIVFAKIISALFFPAQDPTASLMLTFGVFALGYVVRPLGGFLFGHFGDRLGRKKTFVASILLMAIPTFLMGLLPTYETLGITASILLIILRLLQGLSVSGELPGAIIFVAESVPDQHRGAACGVIFFAINSGLLLGSLLGSFLMSTLSQEALMDWGWRIPFLLGGLLGVVSYYLRKKLRETPLFQEINQQQSKEKVPALILFQQYPKQLLKGIGVTVLGATLFTVCFLYLPTYIATQFQFPLKSLFTVNSIAIFIFSIQAVLMAWLSDRVGRKTIMRIGAIGFIVLSYPLFMLFQQGNFALVIATMIIFALMGGCISGTFPCQLVEMFPTRVRYTGFGVAYNITYAIFGGLTPLIVTALIRTTNEPLAPAFWLIGTAVIAFITLFTLKETAGNKLS